MIRCNNCMELFKSENDLKKIVEKSELIDGSWQTTDRFAYDPNMDLNNTEDTEYEIFNGCPCCNSDEYLMDLAPYETEKDESDILETALSSFETGHLANQDDFDSYEEYEKYCGYMEYGPVDFYNEFRDELDFSDDFVSEYGYKEENLLEDLINKFNTYEKCIEFRNQLVNENLVWETYWKDSGGKTIRESENDDSIGTENDYVTIQFVDMIGCDGYSNSKHVFKFAVFIYKNGIEDGLTMHDTIEDAIKDYMETLKLISSSNSTKKNEEDY